MYFSKILFKCTRKRHFILDEIYLATHISKIVPTERHLVTNADIPTFTDTVDRLHLLTQYLVTDIILFYYEI